MSPATPESGEPSTGLRRPGERVPTIASLTGIRALAASWVVVLHFWDIIERLFPGLDLVSPPARYGYLGVEVFFVLSGFILAHNYVGRVETRQGYGRYLWARFARIYPVHLVTLLLAAAIAVALPTIYRDMMGADFPLTVENFLGNALMLHAFPGFWPFNGPAWSVCCETVAYLLFPLLVLAATKASPRVALSCATASLVVGSVLSTLVAGPDPLRSPWLAWSRIGTEFTAGVLLWFWWRARRRDSAWWDACALGAVAATVVLSYLFRAESGITFLAVPVIALFVVACASAGGPFGRLLSSGPMQWGGKVSYSLYMSHFLVYLLLRKLLPWENFVDAGVLARIGWVVALVLWITFTAAGLYYCVEEPSRKLLLRWSGHRARPSGAVAELAARPDPALTLDANPIGGAR